jgi:hexokinase
MSELASVESVSTGSAAPDENDQELEGFLKPLIIDESKLHVMAYQFSTVYRDLARKSEQQFLPTPVTCLPSGEETGHFLAIDVGGTNLRVAFIELLGDAADDNDVPPNRKVPRNNQKRATTKGEEAPGESMAHWRALEDGQGRRSVLLDW